MLYRLLGELFLPFFMLYSLIKSGEGKSRFDKIIIYSPSIFIWPVFLLVRRNKQVRRILILRDMFPQWAHHTGLIKNIFVYKFLLWFSYGQYFLSDKILIQAPSERKYFDGFWNFTKIKGKIETLNNWLRNDQVAEPIKNPNISKLITNYKTIVYAGNIGPTQDVDILIKLAKLLEIVEGYRLIIFGRGYQFNELLTTIKSNCLKNTQLFDEIPLTELRSIYKKCKIGIVSLNSKDQSNNIPGKFVAYLRDGLPILAFCNQKGDLPDMIKTNGLGIFHNNEVTSDQLLDSVIELTKSYPEISKNCKLYFQKEFDVKKIASVLLKF